MADLTYQFKPIGLWTDPLTPAGVRKPSPFKAHYEQTLDLLFREARMLDATRLVLQLDLQAQDIRRDGLPKTNARYGTNPGVIVSFDSRFGPLRYATDTYADWKSNLRAIALGLEALRAVDRYGVSKRGEQYRGWAQIESGAPSASRGAALVKLHGGIKEAMFATHPDRGGSADDFADVQAYRKV